MKFLKKSGATMLVAVVIGLGVLGTGVSERAVFSGLHILIPDAQAIIGRPLTPVSVAGVGRRTVRRCAVGVYDC